MTTDKKTWFITGTSSGFGKHVTELLLKRGDRVAATLRKPEQLDDLAAKYGDQLWRAKLDVTDTNAVRVVMEKAFNELGKIDVVLSNAGQNAIGAAEEFTDEQVLEILNTNLIASIQVARAAIPHLRNQGGGRLLQISSFGGQFGIAGISVYCSSKWGIEGFYESLQTEVSPFGIGVTLIEPGTNNTNMPKNGKLAPAISDYENTPVAQMRGYAGQTWPEYPSDVMKTAQAIIDCADMNPAPMRLTLGPDSYTYIHAALEKRLGELEANKTITLSTAPGK